MANVPAKRLIENANRHAESIIRFAIFDND